MLALIEGDVGPWQVRAVPQWSPFRPWGRYTTKALYSPLSRGLEEVSPVRLHLESLSISRCRSFATSS